MILSQSVLNIKGDKIKMSAQYLKRFNYLMQKLEKLTGYSMLLDEYENKYIDLPDYEQSLNRLNRKLQCEINQLERDLQE